MADQEKIDLSALRVEITQLDEDLLRLLARRREISIEVAKSKIQHLRPVRDVAREQLLMENLVEKGRPLNLDEKFLNDIFRTIIEDSVDRQIQYIAENTNPEHHKDKVKVAFLGSQGTYSHIATNTYFKTKLGSTDAIEEVGCAGFDDIFQAIKTGTADYGMLPVENTSSGSINEVYDLLQKYAEEIHIVGEQSIAVKHSLLTTTSTTLDNIKTIYGHFQPIAQCSQFLSTLSEDVHIEALSSSSAAMKKVAELQDPTVAVIASEQGGKYYGLQTLVNTIANQKEDNHTRFIVISKEQLQVPQQSLAKTSLIMSVNQEPGALVKPLLAFSEYGIDLCKLESRPIHGKPNEEMFYIDALANTNDANFQQALGHIFNERITNYLVLLGCYEPEK
ncbi:chorismate mutase [Saccharobesus litoralis]|uniref:Bifunctional chorismate mutase/prephenate dehydratase n=1 Tax=Saccharobesus litoralis TaxID=2172099 RepID=A0A2S0VL93_9ALTE|nr:chorismate mutase [Saccharobesus litoralis]AWB64984.1 chorismate mutase [Saccharobesus litoralis]